MLTHSRLYFHKKIKGNLDLVFFNLNIFNFNVSHQKMFKNLLQMTENPLFSIHITFQLQHSILTNKTPWIPWTPKTHVSNNIFFLKTYPKIQIILFSNPICELFFFKLYLLSFIFNRLQFGFSSPVWAYLWPHRPQFQLQQDHKCPK